jgi:AbrB family looped-hinge helix DNA binding protein
MMPKLRVSSDFTISIPKEVRDALNIVPGQEIQLVRSGDRIELVPLQSMDEARGFLKGMSTSIEREEDRV